MYFLLYCTHYLTQVKTFLFGNTIVSLSQIMRVVLQFNVNCKHDTLEVLVGNFLRCFWNIQSEQINCLQAFHPTRWACKSPNVIYVIYNFWKYQRNPPLRRQKMVTKTKAVISVQLCHHDRKKPVSSVVWLQTGDRRKCLPSYFN